MSLYVHDAWRKQELKDYVQGNDWFFMQNTAHILDSRADKILWDLDRAKPSPDYTHFQSEKFQYGIPGMLELSTGCKTALNILYFPNTYFDLMECGSNALWYIMRMSEGRVVYSPNFMDDGTDTCDIIYRGEHFVSLRDLIREFKEVID